jgi:Uma2 family endonuclease
LAENVSLADFESEFGEEGLGFKVEYLDGNIYIIEMPSTSHEKIIDLISDEIFLNLCRNSDLDNFKMEGFRSRCKSNMWL